jgi:hypothetical protein
MSVTITASTGPYSEGFIGNRPYRIKHVQMDSSYPQGGYGPTQNFTAAALGLGGYTFKDMILLGINGVGSGIVSAYLDYNTHKLVAIRNPGDLSAALIVEESVTVASNVGKLANIPGYIISINASAGTTTGAFNVVPKSITPATTQCSVNFATGGLTFFSTDAVTTALVTYIPMGIGPFIPANQVIDEAVTLSSSGVNLVNQASLIQYVYDTGNATPALQRLIGNQASPAVATNQQKVNFRNTTHTTLTAAAGNNTDAALVTYWKASAIGLAQGFTAEASLATSSNVLTITSPSIAIPTFGTMLAAVTTVPAIVNESMLGPSGTAAAGNPVWNPFANKFTFVSGDAITNVYFSYINYNDLAFQVSSEAPAGANLSAVTIRAMFIGA